MRFLDARSQAENARQVLDEALKSPTSPNLESKTQSVSNVDNVDIEPVESIASPDAAPVEIEVEVENNTEEAITEIENAIVESPVSKSTKKK
jgi:hypothetical protein